MHLETYVQYSIVKKIHWWIKNCQNNCTCGSALNRIAPFTLRASSIGCKNPQTNPQCSHHLPALRKVMFMPTQRTARCMTRAGSVHAHERQQCYRHAQDRNGKDQTRSPCPFFNMVHTDVKFYAANLLYCLLAGAEIPSIWQRWLSNS